MIKEFRNLNGDEIREVQLYLNSLEKNNKSILQIKEEFNTKVYNFGEGILFAIEKNSIALNMYLKRGFVIDNILSHWIEIA